MSSLAAVRTVRVGALALWLGGGLAMLAAILIVTRYRATDPLRACETVNTLVLTAGKARLAIGLVALAAQAVLFYSRSTAAPSGWRRYAAVLLVMAAAAAAIAGEFSLSLTPLLISSSASADAAASVHLQLSQGGMALLVLEIILVAAALTFSILDFRFSIGGQARLNPQIENRKSKI